MKRTPTATSSNNKRPSRQPSLTRSRSSGVTVPGCRAVKRSRVGPFEESVWIQSHGDKLIEKVYTNGQAMWLVTDARTLRGNGREAYGIVVEGPHIEYGVIELSDIEDQLGKADDSGMYLLYQNTLPCTLRDLFEQTDVHTLFNC